jgi:hypothetical protein
MATDKAKEHLTNKYYSKLPGLREQGDQEALYELLSTLRSSLSTIIEDQGNDEWIEQKIKETEEEIDMLRDIKFKKYLDDYKPEVKVEVKPEIKQKINTFDNNSHEELEWVSSQLKNIEELEKRYNSCDDEKSFLEIYSQLAWFFKNIKDNGIEFKTDQGKLLRGRALELMKKVVTVLKRRFRLKEDGTGKEKPHYVKSDRNLDKSLVPTTSNIKRGDPGTVEWWDEVSEESNIIVGSWRADNYWVTDLIVTKMFDKYKGVPGIGEAGIIDPEKIEQEKEDQPYFKRVKINSDADSFEIVKQNVTEPFKFWVSFTEEEFRYFSRKQNMRPKDISDLIVGTGATLLKNTWRVRPPEKDEEGLRKEHSYKVKFFTNLYSTIIVEDENKKYTRNTYFIILNTFGSRFLIHDMCVDYYNLIDTTLYDLPRNCQIFYRKFLASNSAPVNTPTLKDIRKYINLNTKLDSDLVRNAKNNILKPLKDAGFIIAYKEGIERDTKEPRFEVTRRTSKREVIADHEKRNDSQKSNKG